MHKPAVAILFEMLRSDRIETYLSKRSMEQLTCHQTLAFIYNI